MGDIKYFLSLIAGVVFAVYIVSKEYHSLPPINKGVVVQSDCPLGEVGLAVSHSLADSRRTSLAISKERTICASVSENDIYLIGKEVLWARSKERGAHVIGVVQHLGPESAI